MKFTQFFLDIAQGEELDSFGRALDWYCASENFARKTVITASNPVHLVPECDAEYRKRLKKMVELLK